MIQVLQLLMSFILMIMIIGAAFIMVQAADFFLKSKVRAGLAFSVLTVISVLAISVFGTQILP